MDTGYLYTAYIGTYTQGKSKGIYICRFNAADGTLVLQGTTSELENPTYLCISRDNRFLYAAAETSEFLGEEGGAAGAYSIDKSMGSLKLLNIQPAKGKAPCHLSTDSENRYLFAANYSEGTITVFPLGQDGRIASPSSFIRHKGSGPDKARQDAPHVHYTALTPDEKYLCAVDLGIDRINLYDFSPEKGCPSAAEKLSANLAPGSGPRHMEFSPNGKFAYVLTELSSEVVVFEYDCPAATLNHIQTISTLPSDFKTASYCAAIHFSPCGRYLYASNRGHDSIVQFRARQSTGRLEFVSHVSTGGKFPRDFTIDPTGRFLLAANQNSHNIIVFAISPESGKLEQTGITLDIPDPVCIKFTHLA